MGDDPSGSGRPGPVFRLVALAGREMWRLTALRACPVSDDVAVPSELAVLGRPRSSPQDSVFRFVSDYCASAPVSELRRVSEEVACSST